MVQVAVEGLYEEDRLGVPGGNILCAVSVDVGEADGVKGGGGLISQELFDGAEFARFCKTSNGMILETDHDAIG